MPTPCFLTSTTQIHQSKIGHWAATDQERQRQALEKQSALRATLDRQKEELEQARLKEDAEREETRHRIALDLHQLKSQEERQRARREKEVTALKVWACCLQGAAAKLNGWPMMVPMM